VYTAAAIVEQLTVGSFDRLTQSKGESRSEARGPERLEAVNELISLSGMSGKILVGTPLTDLLATAASNDVLIAEIMPIYEKAPYDFCILRRTRDNDFRMIGGSAIIDKTIRSVDVVERLRGCWTGRMLVVSTSAVKTAPAIVARESIREQVVIQSEPHMEDGVMSSIGEKLVVPKSVDLGIIVKGDYSISYDILITNRSPTPASIFGFTGDCSCFKGVTGPAIIPPMTTQVYRATTDLSRIANEERLAVSIGYRTDDPKLPSGMIAIRAKFDSSKRIFLEPSQIDFGQVDGHQPQEVIIRVFTNPMIASSIKKSKLVFMQSALPDYVSISEQVELERRVWGKYVSYGGYKLVSDFSKAPNGVHSGIFSLVAEDNQIPKVFFKYTFEKL